STQRCRDFIWGGCGGTVPFETRRECRSVCEH
ncbi:MAG: BPTI/Kunitz-type proteinase inhibitor domain-containing protein, partial [Byssovorax sp.]